LQIKRLAPRVSCDLEFSALTLRKPQKTKRLISQLDTNLHKRMKLLRFSEELAAETEKPFELLFEDTSPNGAEGSETPGLQACPARGNHCAEADSKPAPAKPAYAAAKFVWDTALAAPPGSCVILAPHKELVSSGRCRWSRELLLCGRQREVRPRHRGCVGHARRSGDRLPSCRA